MNCEFGEVPLNSPEGRLYANTAELSGTLALMGSIPVGEAIELLMHQWLAHSKDVSGTLRGHDWPFSAPEVHMTLTSRLG